MRYVLGQLNGMASKSGLGISDSVTTLMAEDIQYTEPAMIPFSILDLAHIVEGGDATSSFANSVELAQRAESLGYNRVWYAEHHNIPGVASSATSVLMAHIAAKTKHIRIGAGGVMLPNHSPLAIAEQFGTLETLHPGRIDLGLGRAPGGDQITARALRRNMSAGDRFAFDVDELLDYLGPRSNEAKVTAIPGENTNVPVWILGSSLYGAALAAEKGLPFAFASHFAPQHLFEAVRVYRETFRPSQYLDKPYFMFACNAFVADTSEEASYHYSSLVQAFAQMVTGQRGLLPAPRSDLELPEVVEQHVKSMLKASVIGTKEQVAQLLLAFAELLEPDEIIFSSAFHDPQARLRSMELMMEVREMVSSETAD